MQEGGRAEQHGRPEVRLEQDQRRDQAGEAAPTGSSSSGLVDAARLALDLVGEERDQASFASSEGWSETPPTKNQRRVPLSSGWKSTATSSARTPPSRP